MGARSTLKAEKAISTIKDAHLKADVRPLILDHLSLKSVAAAADRFLTLETRLHGLVLNAGIMNYPYQKTEDGFNIQIQTNYIAHWLLANRPIPLLQSTARSDGPGSVRIACTAYEGHANFGVKGMLYSDKEIVAFGPFGRYGLSKLANVLQAKTLNDQYGPKSERAANEQGEIWAASLHPGFVNTDMNEHNKRGGTLRIEMDSSSSEISRGHDSQREGSGFESVRCN